MMMTVMMMLSLVFSVKTELSLLLLLMFTNLFCRVVVGQYNEPNICISKCVCLTNEGVVSCHENDHIRAMPTNIDRTITKLIIQKGRFDYPTIFSHNLTGLEHLTFLKIIYYNLEVIAPRAFYRMRFLQYLDLSHNKLLKVLDYAFSGLVLSELHLMENLNIQFEPRAFSSMHSSTINLRSNNMTMIDFDLFKNTKVKNLYLYNNSIARIDPRFQQLFNSSTSLLDVSNNPLICDCSLSWLAESLSMQISKEKSFISTKKIHIVCNKPDKLMNRELMYLQPDDLKCLQLKIEEIKINISADHYQIACVAKVGGYKSPTVTWQHYVNDYNKYTVPGSKSYFRMSEDGFRISSLAINTITVSSNLFQKGFIKLICIAAVDENLIQTLEVKINRFTDGGRLPVGKSNETSGISGSSKELDYWFKKTFTLLEMISAIFGTFCATFVSLILVLRYLKTYQSKIINKENENERSKHSNTIKPYWYASNGHSSTYSVPNSNLEYELPISIIPRNEIVSLCSHPPCHPATSRLEFIDYKTHHPIVK